MPPIEPMSVSVSLTRGRGGSDCTVVCVGGEHDISTVPLVWASLALALSFDDVDLVIDLSGVRFMDASTVGVIMRARGLLRPRALRVRAPSPLAQRVLAICQLGELVDAGPSREAVSALGTWVDVPPSSRVIDVDSTDDDTVPARATGTDRLGS
jgi:anti-sigma B factor antagonist